MIHMKVQELETFFQFTTSQGGRPKKCDRKIRKCTFQFTTSQGGRQQSENPGAVSFSFQFTTSQGGRPQPPGIRGERETFNSRPHKEVDIDEEILDAYKVFFQFTTSQGGRQEWLYLNVPDLELSIHDLTRRSTTTLLSAYHASGPFNSRPHKEVDRYQGVTVYLTLLFQFTTSQGGRQVRVKISDLYIRLSIHDLTRRSTRSSIALASFGVSFNSRPHKEVDQPETSREDIREFFQFTTSQGGRRPLFAVRYVSIVFQFTTSQGGRRIWSRLLNTFSSFQFTTSQGGRPSGWDQFPGFALSIHDLTRRSTRKSQPTLQSRRPFNSRPHKEVDPSHPGCSQQPVYLSIHDLTRRST